MLDFGGQKPGPHRVNRARRQKNAIARLRMERVQTIRAPALPNGAFQHGTIDAGFQPGINQALRFRFQDDPCFGLAGIRGIQPGGLGVVGMNLH